MCDFSYGNKAEINLLKDIKTFTSDKLKRCEDKYSLVDYECDEYIVELKTRRCSSRAYPDTMIGANKIKYMLKDDREAIAIFNFKDGTYYIDINKENVAKFRYDDGGRCDRGRVETSKYYYVPYTLLENLYEQPL